ncbi:hypothetical protein [Microbaculum marinum]|uniref:Uncharacterized protein n=1 Tax=Microbaculum marinum TaxID=1764581 RepID=A0AAW9RYB2_9HYPH
MSDSVTKEDADHAFDGGFIRFYGFYWDRKYVNWERKQMLAIPVGRTGQGKTANNIKNTWNCMNFWAQRGVYILYDENLYPVYAGQSGVERKNTVERGSIGDRINAHSTGKYRNGWQFFSWFGFMDCRMPNMRKANPEERLFPNWEEVKLSNVNLNELLSSFEAIVIEGFIPRFNARGGDLKKAVRCEQHEGQGYIQLGGMQSNTEDVSQR